MIDAAGGAMATAFGDILLRLDTPWEGNGRHQGIRADLNTARLWVWPQKTSTCVARRLGRRW